MWKSKKLIHSIKATETILFNPNRPKNFCATPIPDANTGITPTNIYFPTKEKIRYDEDTHTIFWDVENLTNEGTQAKRNIEIQVEVTPSIADVGRNLDLTKEVVFEFFDTFTQTKETVKTKKYTGFYSHSRRTRKQDIWYCCRLTKLFLVLLGCEWYISLSLLFLWFV